MPWAVDNLTKDSNIKSVNKAISKSVSQCMAEPMPKGMSKEQRQKQCVAISLSKAEKATGRDLSKGS